MGESPIDKQWAERGMEISNTGGSCWAAFLDLRGIRFAFTDYHETKQPDPDKALIVEAFDAESGEYLEHTKDVDSLADAMRQLPAWADMLQPKLNS